MTQCGFVTLLGAPNAGKSTLMNQMVGTKVSIVSSKVQTTRARITGILSDAENQLIFVDTPGVFTTPKRTLEKTMVETAWDEVGGGDVTLVLVDAAKKGADNQEALLKRLGDLGSKGPVALVLNKVDLLRPDGLLMLSEKLNAAYDFDATFMVSALTGSGTEGLLEWLKKAVPESPFMFPEDQVSELPERHLAAEITREKLFNALHQELPYNLTVETESWQETAKGIRIEQTIYVARDSHKAMVLGKSGGLIKRLGQASREELSDLLDQPVHLFLFVKVREKWLNDPERYRAMGLTLRP